jgi:hypothetical protein
MAARKPLLVLRAPYTWLNESVKQRLRTAVRVRAHRALVKDLRVRVVMVFSLREWLRVGVIYNYNTNSETSPNPKKLSGALQAIRPSRSARETT